MLWLEVFLIICSYVAIGWAGVAIYWFVTRKDKNTSISFDMKNGNKPEVPKHIVESVSANKMLERSSFMTDDEIAEVIIESYKKAGLSEDEISRRMVGDI